ncbi:MAG: hypothetical protein HY912_12045 [Desulfomonile tiedjei]|uniref:Thioredoxin-like fold domain-containing protein n=1 Tax=Desulfomonile tiedjei TaxID=2358 RepID=A0A9D6V2G9_9BACT|nr:hypothetical protein [Desulfomonile tiedjei]
MDTNHAAGSDSGGLLDTRTISGTQPLLLEVISEGPHCVPCQYAIAAVEYVSEDYLDRIEIKIVETKQRKDASRYLDLCRGYGSLLPVPSILIEGKLVFDDIPGPEELRRVLDEALEVRENMP